MVSNLVGFRAASRPRLAAPGPDRRLGKIQPAFDGRDCQRTASHSPANPGSFCAVDPQRPWTSARSSGARTAEYEPTASRVERPWSASSTVLPSRIDQPRPLDVAARNLFDPDQRVVESPSEATAQA